MSSTRAKGPFIRRLHILKTGKYPHFFAEITLGKNKPIHLLHIFGDDATILAAGTSLFECESIYHGQTDSQFRTSEKLDFDNRDLRSMFLLESIQKAYGKSESSDIIAAKTQSAIMMALSDNRISAEFNNPATAIHSQQMLYEVRKDGTADYGKRSMFLSWSRGDNAFVAHFECVMDEYGLIGLRNPKFFLAAGNGSTINQVHDVKNEACLNSIASGKFECMMAKPAKEELVARHIDKYMSESGNFTQLECDESCGTFSAGLVYETATLWNVKHPLEQMPSDIVAFDDFGNASVISRNYFSDPQPN